MEQIAALIDRTTKETTDFRIELQNHLVDSLHKAIRDYGANSETAYEITCIFINNRYMSANARTWFANNGIVFSKR